MTGTVYLQTAIVRISKRAHISSRVAEPEVPGELGAVQLEAVAPAEGQGVLQAVPVEAELVVLEQPVAVGLPVEGSVEPEKTGFLFPINSDFDV